MKFATLSHWLLPILLCLITNVVFGQQTLKGVVMDNENEPLIGATVMIKGTDRGTVTDIDGSYEIKCSPKETLVISYTGYPNTETVLTKRSFRRGVNKNNIKQEKVKKITSSAYEQAIEKNRDTTKIKASPSEKFIIENRIGNYRKIKEIRFDNKKVIIKSLNDPWKYHVGLSQNLAFSFVPNYRLPQLQTTFAGGTNESGVHALLNPDAIFPQAFGPAFSELKYDGIPTTFNPAGQLIFNGGTNGSEVRTTGPDIFPSVLVSATGLNLKFAKRKKEIHLHFKNQTGKDVFGVQPYHNNRVALDLIKRFDQGRITLKGELERNRNNQSNRNGLANGIYQFAYQSLTEFPLEYLPNQPQNITATMGPFDNPFFLLENAFDRNTQTRWNLGAAWNENYYYNHQINFSVQTNISGNRQKVNFEPGENQVGELSNLRQNYQSPVWQNQLDLTYNFDHKFSAKFIARHNFEKLTYQYSQESIDDQSLNLKRNNLDLVTQVIYNKFNNNILENVYLYNQIFISSYDQKKYFLPGLSLRFSAKRWLKKIKPLDNILLSGEFNQSVYQQLLLYQNQSWYYTGLGIFDQANYSVYPELATPENLELESRTNFAGNLKVLALNNLLELNTRYYHTRRNEVVGHQGALENTRIQNLATLREQGLEIDLTYKTKRNRQQGNYFNAQLIFELNRSKVIALREGIDAVVLGGNVEVQQVLRPGTSSGALWGTTWLRNSNGAQIIDETGYPMVNNERSMIGDALPDFRLKFNLSYEHERYSAGLNLTYSKGGQAWNGTLASLDYLGLSQNSGTLRSTEDFVFLGVNMDGNSNTTAVNFGESNGPENLNRWQRYGPGGVGEAYVEDASFLTLSNIYLGYRFVKNGNVCNHLSLRIYANNLISWLPFSGFSPYRTFRDLDATPGIQFFNLPMNSEIGLTLTMKI